MAVLRIVADLSRPDSASLAAFYQRLLGLETVMEFGWITTLASSEKAGVLLSLASGGGSGTAVPHLSIEVDNLDEVYQRALDMVVSVEYGPVLEPWGVRRFYLLDPSNNLFNILTHADAAAGSGETDDL